RPPDVPEQLLDDRGGADVLHADRVLRPADRVTDGARALAPGVACERLRDREEVLDGAAARVGHELGRVPLVMLLQELEDAAWMLEVGDLGRRLAVPEADARAAVPGLVAARAEALFALTCRAVRLHPLVLPRRRVVVVLLRVPA